MNKQFSKRLSLLMVVVMVMAMMPIAGFAQSSDLSGHWSESVVSEWMTKGLISGYPDGSFKPDGSMTRAEFMAIVNKVYNFTSEKDISYKDVALSSWYFGIAKKAAAAGYISGYPDGTLKPNQPITRQEVAAIFCKLESLNADPAAANFKDLPTDSWAKGYIGAAVKAGFFTGYSDGTFKGNASIKRGEAVVATNKVDLARAVTYTKAGTYGPATGTEFVSKNVIVKADGVVLQNMTIKGDLTIDEAVGEGDVSLENVVVQGQLYVKGGGANSIKINGGSYGKIFIMKQADTPVRLLTVNVKNIDVVIPPEAGGGQVVLEGTFNSVSVLASKVELKTQGNTTINEVKFDKVALEVKVNLGGQTVIAKLITDVVIKVLGQGRIIVAEATVRGVTFERLPETVKTTVDGTTTTTDNPPSTTPSTGGTSSGGSSGGDGEDSTKAAATPTASPAAGVITSGSSVTLSTATANASIYYTTDGTTPTTASTLYSTPIIVTGASVTIKAIATASGYANSGLFSGTYYTQVAATPTANPAAGAVAAGSTVTLTTTTADASIYYTVDGSTPTTSSTLYSTAIPINSGTVTIKAIAVATNYNNSEVFSGTYTAQTAATPTAAPTAGYIASGSSVTLSTTTGTATIHYTTDGSTPTASSPSYSTPIPVTGPNMTIKAIAVATNYANSAVFSGTYYTVPNTADVTITSGSAIFSFEFYADGAKSMAIPYADVIDPSKIALDLSNSTVAIALTSNAAIVTSTAAISFQNLGINVTSGSVTFTSSGAIAAKFGNMSGWTGFPNTILLHLEFIGGQIGNMDITVDLTTEEVNIIYDVMQITYAPTLLKNYLANNHQTLLL